LAEAAKRDCSLSIKALSDLLGIHPNTLRANLKEAGVYQHFTTISNGDLDIFAQGFQREMTRVGAFLYYWFFTLTQTKGPADVYMPIPAVG